MEFSGLDTGLTSALISRVRTSNAQAREALERWAPHRGQVMQILRKLPLAGSRMALLGAGHLHDVEFDELMRACAHVDLVDLDAKTVGVAVSRTPDATERCTVHAPVDLTGALDVIANAGLIKGAARIAHERLATARCELPGAPFDVVVSLCALTQLMQTVSDAGVDSADIPPLSLAIRDKHLRDLLTLTAPGGTFVLVTDFVSTASAPGLLAMQAAELEPELSRLVAAGNFFTGTNPYRILALLAGRSNLSRAKWNRRASWAHGFGRCSLSASIWREQSSPDGAMPKAHRRVASVSSVDAAASLAFLCGSSTALLQRARSRHPSPAMHRIVDFSMQIENSTVNLPGVSR